MLVSPTYEADAPPATKLSFLSSTEQSDHQPYAQINVSGIVEICGGTLAVEEAAGADYGPRKLFSEVPRPGGKYPQRTLVSWKERLCI